MDTTSSPAKINIWLDDERDPPQDWWHSSTVRGCIAYLGLLCNFGTGCNIISLDHDLGDDESIGTGYDVLKWIEEQVATNEYFVAPNEIRIHTANPSARIKMNLCVESINRIKKQVHE
jgi:hypothetical protein